MQYRDPKTGARVSVDPAIARWLRILADDDLRASHAANLAALDRAAESAAAAAESAARDVAAHEYARLLAVRDAAAESAAAAAESAAAARHGAPPAGPSDADRRAFERAARNAGWSEAWRPPGDQGEPA